MVGGDHIQTAVQQGLPERFFVFPAFDGRIPLDAGAVFHVIFLIKPQMMHTYLRGDLLLACGQCVVEELHLAGGGEMQHMQACAVLAGQGHGLGAGTVTGLRRPYLRVQDKRDIDAEFFFVFLQVFPDHGIIFGMHGHQHRGFGEDTFQALRVVHQHVARGRAHEYLDAADAGRIELTYFLYIVVGSAEIKGIVGDALSGCQLQLFFQQVYGDCLGFGVGHVHHGGDPAGDGGG